MEVIRPGYGDRVTSASMRTCSGRTLQLRASRESGPHVAAFLSRNIQELERRLGVALFTRNQGGVEPTAAGVILLEQAAEVLSRSNDLVREMDLLRGLQKGELNIGAGIYPGPMFVDRAVGRLIRDHPAARVSLNYDHAINLFPRLLKREFDLTVIYVACARG
jgi:DNA-binding transcriptional LysR family regulator